MFNQALVKIYIKHLKKRFGLIYPSVTKRFQFLLKCGVKKKNLHILTFVPHRWYSIYYTESKT